MVLIARSCQYTVADLLLAHADQFDIKFRKPAPSGREDIVGIRAAALLAAKPYSSG